MPRFYRTWKGMQQTGAVALGVGTFVYLYHKNHHGYSLFAEVVQNERCTLVSPESDIIKDRAAVPSKMAKLGPLILQLKQVQVLFRHGVRTPLHFIPKLHEANYESQFLMREHQASLFPYERIKLSNGESAEWLEFEKTSQTPLKSGVCGGMLTAYGKDQMYVLGNVLRNCYMDDLNLATYDPNEVIVISSNIKRTVESARCVLAGFFGKKQLKAFSEFCNPVKIYVTDKEYNILVPGTTECNVLKKVNQAAMSNSDSFPGFKEQRLALEKKINKEREKNMECVEEIQKKINLSNSLQNDALRKKTQELNKYHQLYLRDPILHPLVEERSKIIARVDRLWVDAMVRNPHLSQVITDVDVKALIYLRRLEVEEFNTYKHRSGYRFHFYFDSNPYFYNDHLCKEVYFNSPPGTQPSWSIPILWKECANLLTGLDASGEVPCQCQQNVNDVQESCTKTSGDDNSEAISFFQWYTQPTHEEDDSIGKAIKDEVWADPVKSLEGKREHPDDWQEDFNFINARDDLSCRLASGLEIPKELKDSVEIIIENATKMLYYSMTGQGFTERSVITRLSAGPLLTAIVDSVEDSIKGKEGTPKLFLYSAHDSTMTAMLEALGIWYDKWPPFSADLRIELYKDVQGTEHYVRVLYCGSVQRIRGQMEDFLHWADFKKNVLKFLIREDGYWSICNSNVLEQMAKNTYNGGPPSATPA